MIIIIIINNNNNNNHNNNNDHNNNNNNNDNNNVSPFVVFPTDVVEVQREDAAAWFGARLF